MAAEDYGGTNTQGRMVELGALEVYLASRKVRLYGNIPKDINFMQGRLICDNTEEADWRTTTI